MPSILSSALPTSSRAAARTQTASQDASPLAPVFQFACLFTHDIRRKNTKRWQDGYLSYHTFNGRVMVYDDSRHYIGDTYQKDAAVDDGDELTLGSGVLIQVGEKKATEETDLTELLAKRQPKPVESDDIGPPRNAQPLRPHPSNVPPSTLQSQPQRRWTGWAARAQIPTQSPHALRQQTEAAVQKENVKLEGPPRKKQRQDDEHVPLWQVLKTSKPARSQVAPGSMLPPSSRLGPKTPNVTKSNITSTKALKSAGQSMFAVKQIIDITESSSDQTERPPEPVEVPPERQDEARDERRRPSVGLNQANGHSSNSRTHSDGASRDPGGVYNSPIKPPRVHKSRAIVDSNRKAPSLPDETRQAQQFVTAHGNRGNTPDEREMADQRKDDARQLPRNNISKVDRVSETTTTAALPLKKVHNNKTRPNQLPSNAVSADVAREVGRENVPLTVVNARKTTPDTNAPRSSPPVSTTSIVSAAEAAVLKSQPMDEGHEKRSKAAKPKQLQTKPLRLSSAAPRKMLLCQSMPASKEPAVTSRPSSTGHDRSLPKESRKRKPPQAKTAISGISTVAVSRVIDIDDDESELDFEVMKPKNRRREEAHEERSNSSHTNAVPVATAAETVSTGLGEGSMPSITNQIDQRPRPLLADIVEDLPIDTTCEHATARLPPQARVDPGIAYGTARLDAEFLSPVLLTALKSDVVGLEERPAPQETIKLPKVSEAKGTAQLPPPQPLQPVSASKYNRPFRRVTSDVSPIKKPFKSSRRTLRRAETISIPQETRKQQQARLETRQQETKDTDVGPWSREAWDLFGECPRERTDRPIWPYDVLAEATADVDLGSSLLSPVAA